MKRNNSLFFKVIIASGIILGILIKSEVYSAAIKYTLSSNTVSAANVYSGSNNVPIQSFIITSDAGTSPGNFTGLNFVTTGTYTTSDVTTFKLWYNTSNNLAAATQLGTNLTATAPGTQTFAAFTRAHAISTTYYFWITMDVTPGATNSQTIAVNALTTTNLTYSSGSKLGGPTTAGGNQTIVASLYCVPSSTNTTYWIKDFSTTGGTANITNTATAFSAGGYGDYTAKFVTQQQLNSVNFTFNASTTSAYGYLRIWVDWNVDGDFDDTGENVYSTPGGSVYTASGSFSVPANSTVGSTRMRVRFYQAALPTSCGSITWGEAEDYTFNVTAAPAMSYVSCTTTQANTNTVAPSSTNQQILGIEVVTAGITSPFAATSFTIRTTGSTDPVADIMMSAGVKIYSTGSSSTFATTTLFGSAAPAGTTTDIVINGNQSLSTGTNYFWITYDIDCDATVTNVLDAICTNVTMNGVGGSRTPSPTGQTGTRAVANAMTVQVGSGTYTSAYLPIYPYYVYTYCQSIYNPAEIGGAGTITKLRFQYNGATAWTDNNVDIYMGHTAKSTFSSSTDWVISGNMTKVGNAVSITTTTTVGSWVTITLTTPFVYNGTDNLIIAVDENTTGYHGSSDYFYATSCTGNKSLRYYNDVTNPDPATIILTGSTYAYRPNIQLDITPAAAMSLTSIATTQYTADMHRGDATSGKDAMDERVIGIEITTVNANNPFSVTQFQVNMTGSTTIADFSKVKMYYTGTSNMFGVMNQFGSTVSSIPVLGTTINFEGSQVLSPGTNYFWLTYDVKPGATINDIADAQCTQVTLSGCPGSQVPSPTSPAGSRKIIDYPASFSIVIGNNIAPNNAWGRTMIHDGTDDTYIIGGRMQNSAISTYGADDFVIVKLKTDGTLVWSTDIGDATMNICEKIIKTTDGGYLAVGETGADIDNTSALVVKLTSTGTVSWTKTFENGGTDMAFNVVQNGSDDYVIVGKGTTGTGYNTRMMIWKLSSNGNTLLEEKAIDNLPSVHPYEAYDVIITSDGGYAIVGSYYPGGSDLNFCFVKLNSSLAYQGSYTWGGSGQDELYKIIQNSVNDYSVFGTTHSYTDASSDFYAMRFTFNPSAKSAPVVLWAKTYGTIGNRDECKAATITNDGGYIMTGLTDAIGSGGDEVYTIKLDMNGDMKWGRSVGTGTWDDEGYAIATTSTGDYIIGGLANRPQTHYYLVKLDEESGFCCGNTGTGGTQHNETVPTLTVGNSVVATSTLAPYTLTTFTTPSLSDNRNLPTATVLCKTTISLPVELLYFTGYREENVNILKWSTASEINNDFFTIERSNDIESWEAIGKVFGVGNSNNTSNYSLTDKDPLDGTNYYRLKQTDFDGNSEYSGIVAISKSDDTNSTIKVFPNPFTNTLCIQFSSSASSDYSVEIINYIGQSVKTQTITMGNILFEMKLDDLPNGIYYAKIYNEQSAIIKKLVKE